VRLLPGQSVRSFEVSRLTIKGRGVGIGKSRPRQAEWLSEIGSSGFDDARRRSDQMAKLRALWEELAAEMKF
jgi:hypothetical protein